MKKVAKLVGEQELSVEERNLLSVAYKNVIGARRASWRIVSSIEQKEESKGNDDHVASIRKYRAAVRCMMGSQTRTTSGPHNDLPSMLALAEEASDACSLQVEKELTEICASILSLLDEHLIPSSSSGESKVFYLKMKGDYHRYLAEFKTSAERKESADHTLLAYKAAQVTLSQRSDPHAFAHATPCVGHRRRGPASHTPHPPGPGPKLLRLLLRDPQLARACMPSGQAGRCMSASACMPMRF